MSIAEKVREYINQLPVGQPFMASNLSTLGPRSAVERTLSRLVNSEHLIRCSRGVYSRQGTSKYGIVEPSSMKVALVKAKGNSVQMHGADALVKFGLSTQHPVQSIYYTAGPSCHFTVAGRRVTMKKISPRKLVLPGTNVGLAITAMWYLGRKKLTKKALSQIKHHLTESEYKELLANADKMPAWMSDALHRFKGTSHG